MNTGPKVEPYTFISDGVLDRSSGIGAKVEVAPTPGTEPRQGKQVIVFQLMNDTTPVSIFAIEADPISTAKEFAAFFDVEDAAQLSYTVKVFVLDQLDQELTASVSLAVPTLLK
ncbi:hypothetical protein [Paenibacillus sp. PL91]|uniref:hypothetical protein n=1 Tax=Paenibacillus sp. PL91 TaxID=2729538 RepID=UPI00145C70EC|nr:hypothetical protein [Paenibacillus sp. PL91]MBC9198753.1 hypothetical protein [Paenibacillus sp. PL91]